MARTKKTQKAEGKKVTSPVETKKESKTYVTEAILYYVNNPSINENVAKGTLSEEDKVCVGILDKAMLPLSELELSRLVTKDVIAKYMEQTGATTIKELAGKTVENAPYMSTTLNPLRDILAERYHLGLDKPICIVVHTGKTGKVMGLDTVAEMKAAGFGGGRCAKQKEVILARGQKFLIKNVEIGDGWGEAYPILHLEVV